MDKLNRTNIDDLIIKKLTKTEIMLSLPAGLLE